MSPHLWVTLYVDCLTWTNMTVQSVHILEYLCAEVTHRDGEGAVPACQVLHQQMLVVEVKMANLNSSVILK